jgi:hypothetical protein
MASQLGNRWCPGEDSNLHDLRHWYLKPARLPIPPPGQAQRHKGAGFRLSTRRRGIARFARPQEAARRALVALYRAGTIRYAAGSTPRADAKFAAP